MGRWIKEMSGTAVVLGVLIAAFALAPAVQGLAADDDGAESSEQVMAQLETFTDLESTVWAKPAVQRMHVAGMIQGRSQGRFAPDAQITRAEAVTLAVRLLELEERAEAMQDSELSYTDMEGAAWARGYVAVARQYNLYYESEATDAFRPNAPASRAWVTDLLTQALQQQGEVRIEAAGEADAFADLEAIPDWAAPAVSTAVDAGLITGYEVDGEFVFRPDESITRAEIAVILDRAAASLDAGLPAGRVSGTVTAVSEADGTITIDTGEEEPTYDIAGDAHIYADARAAVLTDIKAGDVVSVLVANETAVLVEVRSSDADDATGDDGEADDAETTVSGRLRYVPLEGGFYGLVTADGQRLVLIGAEQLDVDLPQEDTAVAAEVHGTFAPKDTASIYQWGRLFHVDSITLQGEAESSLETDVRGSLGL